MRKRLLELATTYVCAIFGGDENGSVVTDCDSSKGLDVADAMHEKSLACEKTLMTHL